MTKSIAAQSVGELGGSLSILARQKRDHIELDRLLRAVDTAGGQRRQELLTQVCRLVFPHAFAEESVLWPVARRVLSDGEQLTLVVEREHQQINELFTSLERTAPDDAGHRALWARIAALLREDVRDEEDALLPRLQASLSLRQLVLLGVAWEVVRRTAPTRPHPVVSRRPPGNVVAALPLTVIDRLRDGLDRTARGHHGRVSTAARTTSSALVYIAGAVEHAPPLTRGEDPSTKENHERS
ncbi:hemerythrin domain-containing protein [Mycolicibacterium murale]|uniref:hemerythrin domain-containing protein n=1 Tax=Mycolicibacterium murale TaxID=182220 RepID=UPI0018758429|nr:hemerythrin domain-containing protein [Mycolicibacterium murale]MCV7185880.1 hemerythrin domain-containing protein [Mycolicibacterium murale]